MPKKVDTSEVYLGLFGNSSNKSNRKKICSITVKSSQCQQQNGNKKTYLFCCIVYVIHTFARKKRETDANKTKQEKKTKLISAQQ